jgi:hypothetical protein
MNNETKIFSAQMYMYVVRPKWNIPSLANADFEANLTTKCITVFSTFFQHPYIHTYLHIDEKNSSDKITSKTLVSEHLPTILELGTKKFSKEFSRKFGDCN